MLHMDVCFLCDSECLRMRRYLYPQQVTIPGSIFGDCTVIFRCLELSKVRDYSRLYLIIGECVGCVGFTVWPFIREIKCITQGLSNFGDTRQKLLALVSHPLIGYTNWVWIGGDSTSGGVRVILCIVFEVCWCMNAWNDRNFVAHVSWESPRW